MPVIRFGKENQTSFIFPKNDVLCISFELNSVSVSILGTESGCVCAVTGKRNLEIAHKHFLRDPFIWTKRTKE
ncbi:hypothetical protein D915_010053 [Fasciola hepatica]|uniref:Uncharacterized protein n=1 Tax=Fasciola hepatica TaxID=6192 RepID=A0A4E0R0R8_FASHE|nr:hypothetical protein D915_010053 [Fasciola hepatica]